MQTTSLSTNAWKVRFRVLISVDCHGHFFNTLMFNMFFLLAIGVCKMYEEHLKRMNPNSPSITYDISQLFDFVDDLADLSCLV